MNWDDWELLAGLTAAASGGRNARFDPAGIDAERRLSLAETLLDRDWIRAARPLFGDGHLIEIRGVQLSQAGRDARATLLASSESGPPSSVDPETAWAALSDHAEPGSPLAEAIGRERSELSGRGMVRSGTSRQRALQVAAEHDLGWDEQSDGFVPDSLLLPRLDDSQRTLLDITAELFVEASEWPRVRAVIRRAVRDKGVSGLDEAVWSLPKLVGHSDGQQIVLSSEGLAATPYGGTVLEALVAFARSAAEAYMSEAEEPTVSTTAVVRALNLDKGVLLRLNTLLKTEGFFLGSGHEDSDSDGWVYEVTAAAAEFQDCPSVEDYLRVRRRVMRPVPVVSQRPDANHPPTGAAPPGRVVVSGLHEAIAEHAGELYANGHYSQAIFEALKALEVRVRQQSGIDGSGRELMDKAFKGAPPPIDLRHASGQSGKDEQEGFRFIFMGAMQGIRNPKGHDLTRQDDPVRALEYLALASLLFRRLDDARAEATPDEGRGTSS